VLRHPFSFSPVAVFLTILHAGLWLMLAGNLWYLHRPSRTEGESPSDEDDPGRLSVLVPARNEERNLQRLLPSLLEQDHPRFEVIVYDDGSTDGTAEVLEAAEAEFREKEGATLRLLQGNGPPAGWVGKTHALHEAAQEASGDVFLFLDADARLEGPGALRSLARRFRSRPEDTDVLTGFPRLRGAALLLVSIVPNAILTGLPWPLVRRTPGLPSLGALNGQCWMIDADTYHRHQPHAACKSDVLEDVEIGRFLKSEGHTPVMRDVRGEVSIFMYDRYAEAWRGFRKNAYLLMGGTPPAAVLFTSFFLLTFVLAPFFVPWLWASVFGLKAVTDGLGGQPPWVSLFAPLSFLLAVAMQVDSTASHLRGTVEWKGRRVAS
jgi:glycosyltransferase involved in cell wall biosynthesis